MRQLNTSKHLWSFEHTFNASAEIVSKILCDVTEGSFKLETAPLILRTFSEYPEIIVKKETDKDKYSVYEQKNDSVKLFNIVCDRDAQVLIIYGGWWYYGKYSLEEKGKETILHLDAYNAARKYTRWMAAPATLGQKDNDKRRFESLVKMIEERLILS
jgi:hypothetical protein